MTEFFNTYAPLLWFLTTGLVVIALVWLAWLSFGREDGGEEEAMRQEAVASRVAEISQGWEEFKNSAAGSLQAVGIAHYDAYPDVGGERSFSVALSDSEGNGVVITSLYGRSNTRLHVRRLYFWEPDAQMSQQELEAVEEARRQVSDGKTPEALETPEK